MNASEALSKLWEGKEPEALLAVVQSLPKSALRADEGSPSLLEALVNRQPEVLNRNLFEPKLQPFIDTFAWIFTHRANVSPELGASLLNQAMTWSKEGEAMVNEVWRLTSQKVEASSPSMMPLLSKALNGEWSTIVEGLLSKKIPTDVSQVPSSDNPFTHVATRAQFDALLTAGFDPLQKDADQHDGVWLLRKRQNNTFAHGRERDAIVKRLPALTTNVDVSAQVTTAAQTAQKWHDVNVVLDAIGPAWMDATTSDGTAMHTILRFHPEYLPSLVMRPDLQRNVNAWQTLDARGDHALIPVWFRLDTPSYANMLDQLETSRAGQDVLNTLPRFKEPDAALRLFLKESLAYGAVLPRLHAQSFWKFQQRMGGWDEMEAKKQFETTPDLQQAFDAIVWNPRRFARSSDTTANLSGITSWISNDTPWLLNYRLLEESARLLSEKSLQMSKNAQNEQRQIVQRCEKLMDQGASWGWVNDKVMKSMWPVHNHNVWTSLGNAWERQQLLETTDQLAPVTALPKSRSRL